MNGAPGVPGQATQAVSFSNASPGCYFWTHCDWVDFCQAATSLSSLRKLQKRRLSRPIGDSTTLIIGDGLPELDAISFRIGEPPKLPEVVGFAIGIDCDTFAYQAIQHTIEIIHLEIDH